MNRLIKNELIKIFSKKSFWILSVILIGIMIVNNIATKYMNDYTNSGYDLSEENKYYEEMLKNLDPNKPEDYEQYIENKTNMEIIKLERNYNRSNWQFEVIEKFVSNEIRNINVYTYGNTKDSKKLKEAQNTYDLYMNKIKENDWKYFAQKEKADIDAQYNIFAEQIKQNPNDNNLKVQYEAIKANKEVADLRINKNINYGSEDYKSKAVNKYLSYITTYNTYLNKDGLTREDEISKDKAQAQAMLIKYDLENDKEYQNKETAIYNLKNAVKDNLTFIIMMCVILAGVAISEEFNKGTIKLLLVRPYSRTKILLSKLIAVFVTILGFIVYVIIAQIIIGGIIHGFNTYSLWVPEFDIANSKVMMMNVFSSLGLSILGYLPMIILLGTLAFTLSTLFLNSPLAIAFPILGHMMSETINMVAISYHWDWVKFFVTPNWDLTKYWFGGKALFTGIGLEFSILICIIYFVFMLAASIEVFKRRDIKNV